MTTRKAPPAAEGNKRARVDAALRSQLEEHRCPITLELLVDPVVAPDGRLYEREAITRWLDTTNRVVVGRSPATNRMMVGELVAVYPVRNAIEALIEGGCVAASDEAPWQMRRGRMLEARGDRAGAAKCFERARALGFVGDALSLRNAVVGDEQPPAGGAVEEPDSLDRRHVIGEPVKFLRVFQLLRGSAPCLPCPLTDG